MEKRSELSPWKQVFVVIILLLMAIDNACSEESSKSSLSWDCWIQVDHNPVSIACIHDRGGSEPEQAEDQEAILEDLLLNHIHDKIHAEQTAGLSQLISENFNVFRIGTLWIIPIYSVPYEDAWVMEYPQLLISTLLCPNGMLCTVNIKPPH